RSDPGVTLCTPVGCRRPNKSRDPQPGPKSNEAFMTDRSTPSAALRGRSLDGAPMTTRTTVRSRAVATSAVVGALALTAATFASPAAAAPQPAAKPASSVAGPSDINGFRSVGYVMADSRVTRDFHVVDLLRTGAIEDLTHINYAFGNVTTDLVCDRSEERRVGKGGT